MSDEPPEMQAERIGRNALVLVPIYSLTVSLIYLGSYWGIFEVNVFQYIAPSQIVLLAAYALLPFVLGSVLAIPAFIKSAQSKRPRMAVSLATLILLGVAMACITYVSPYQFPFCAALLLAALVAEVFLSRLQKFSRSALLRFVSIVAVILAMAAAGAGASRAFRIRYGFSENTVEVVADSSTSLARLSGADVHHLGHVGDYDFFFVPGTESVVMVPAALVKEITIKHRELCFRCVSIAGGDVEKLNPLSGE